MDGTSTPRGTRTARSTDQHPRTTDQHPRTPTSGLDLDLASSQAAHAPAHAHGHGHGHAHTHGHAHGPAHGHETGTHETRLQAGAGRRPNGSWTGVANPNRVRVGSDGAPCPGDRRHD